MTGLEHYLTAERLQEHARALAAAYESRVRASVNRLQARVLDDALRAAVHEFAESCSRSAAGIDLSLEYPYGSVADKGRRLEAIERLQREAVNLAADYSGLTKLLADRLRREMDRRYLATDAPQPDALEGT
jgi:hypothetical protein